MNQSILLVDDDSLLCRSVAYNLRKAGFEVAAVETAKSALQFLDGQTPDLILLDIGLPDRDGLELMRLFQNRFDVPVIFVTGRKRDLDEILGLELGGDDYVTKPFDNDVLIAHIRAVLRRGRSRSRSNAPLVRGDLRFDLNARAAFLKGTPLNLSPREYKLLLTLAQRDGQVLSVEEILSRVWGDEWIGETQTVYVHIRWLREKLERDPARPQRLVTVKGLGYRLNPVAGS